MLDSRIAFSRSAGALVSALLLAACCLSSALGSAAPERTTFSYAMVPSADDLPIDMLHPESRNRWDLEFGEACGRLAETVRVDGKAVVVSRRWSEGGRVFEDERRYEDAEGGDGALEFAAPHVARRLLPPGQRRTLRLVELRGGVRAELLVELEGVGAGWADLPIGPYEVALERALVSRRSSDTGSFEPDSILMRWVAPRHGVVARRIDPVQRGAGAGSFEATVLDKAPDSTGPLAISADELRTAVGESIQFGWNMGSGTPVSDLTPDASIDDVGKLIDLDFWDFSGNTSAGAVTEIVSTIVPLDEDHTCNIDPGAVPEILSCGYNNPGGGRVLARQDEDFDGSARITNTVFERETLSDKVVVWQRAGRQDEGVSGAFGDGESGFCYDPDFDASVQRTPVAQWEFAFDGTLNDFVMQPLDEWASSFICEQNIFNRTCGVAGLFSDLYSSACTTISSGTHDGEQRAKVLKEGVVKLPSGHTLNVLLIRIKADFCVFSGSTCSSLSRLEAVRKFIYLWVAPQISTVVRLQSSNLVDDPEGRSFSTFEETDIKFGLFPPLSIAASVNGNDSITLSWNPGNETSRIDGYKVYWDTVSGASSAGAYAFDSDRNPGQVAFNGTGATISGLASDTTYYFTVSSLYSHADALSGQVTAYESLVFPMQIFGDPDFAYPSEVMATTGGGACTPAEEVSGLTVGKVSLPEGGETLRFCWTLSTDACVEGYDLLGSDDPSSDAGFATVAQTGEVECVDIDPPDTFYLVTGRGSGGQGPWGHYGR